MVRYTNTVKTAGVQGIHCAIEASVTDGVGIHLVGLADAAVKESLLRTVTALQANGYRIPGRRVIVNIAPADLRKDGTGFDLGIALSLIAASEQDDGTLDALEEWLIVGELGLDGSVRTVPGCIQAVEAAMEHHLKGVIIPMANAGEVAPFFGNDDIPVFPVRHLREAVAVIGGGTANGTAEEIAARTSGQPTVNSLAFAYGRLEPFVQRALLVAAAGGHGLLLAGAPGSGKATAARALRSLLPPMSRKEALAVAEVYSVSGRGRAEAYAQRPFRAPHASSSLVALLGGGCGDSVLPGEVSLAAKGVLYIDEAEALPRSVSEAMRGILSDRQVTISRLRSKVTFSADLHLVTSSQLCPCGYYGEGDRCSCKPSQRATYLSRVREAGTYGACDLQVFCHDGTTLVGGISDDDARRDTEAAAAIVAEIRRKQLSRFEGEAYRLNAEVPAKDAEKYLGVEGEAGEMLDKIVEALGISVTSRLPILRIARTIADIEGHDSIMPSDVAVASAFRFLDRRD